MRQLRQFRELSQEQLAELIDKTPKHIGEIERGEANVGLDSLTAIAQVLSVDVVELLGAPTKRDLLTDDERALLEQALQLIQRLTRFKI